MLHNTPNFVLCLMIAWLLSACSTLENKQPTDALAYACATSPVLITDLKQRFPLQNTQLPDGRSCQGQRV